MAVSAEPVAVSLDLFRLDGKVALVTGASRGLGAAMAVALASAIMRMLEKRPEDRWPTLHEARVALTTGLTPGDDAPRRTLADMVRAVSPAPQPFEITPASPVPRGPATPPRVPPPAKQTPASAPPSPAPAPAPLWSSPRHGRYHICVGMAPDHRVSFRGREKIQRWK